MMEQIEKLTVRHNGNRIQIFLNYELSAWATLFANEIEVIDERPENRGDVIQLDKGSFDLLLEEGRKSGIILREELERMSQIDPKVWTIRLRDERPADDEDRSDDGE